MNKPDKQNTTTDILPAKKHFEILDGLRGIAALAVVIFHFMEVAYTDYSQNFIAHGFLAVDFFFCLSGFVIAYAYDDRLQKIGVMEFFKARIIRLHPLVIAGAILGLLSYLFDPFGGHPELTSISKLLLVFVSSLFLIPLPVMEDRYFNLFGLNAPAWSLFWEYVANIFYALILHKIAKRFLLVLTIIAGVTLGIVSYQQGSLMGGWSKQTFWDGCARISYSFLAGMLIYRFKWIINNKLGFAGVGLLLALAFLLPFSLTWNWLTELLVVLFYFPLLIALGAGSVLSNSAKGICIFSGKISYPLYMTHYAVLWMFANYYYSHTISTVQLFLIILISTIVLIGFAYLVMRLYDIPVRKYLAAKWRKAGK